MGGHFFEPLVRDTAATGHVAQERDDILLSLGPTEGGENHGIEVTRLRGPGSAESVGDLLFEGCHA